MDAFKVIKRGKLLDYRVGQLLDLEAVRTKFAKKFEIIELKNAARHVIGILRTNDREYILKLSTTEGIGVRTETEKLWNDEFNRLSNNSNFFVPKNLEDGLYDRLYYIIMEKFNGSLVGNLNSSTNSIEQHLGQIIKFQEHIQSLPLTIQVNDAVQNANHQDWFVEKTKTWLDSIPKDVVEQYDIQKLFELTQKGAGKLKERPRHGDFTPWHLIILEQGLGLIDGEHAHSHGVENYDICYFIQRVHSVLKLSELAKKIFDELIRQGYNKEKLRTVLAARAIGGFLDESFKRTPTYESGNDFKDWILNL